MRRALDRRTVLRGLGTAVALPWLEAFASAQDVRGGKPPARLAYVYAPNGMIADVWNPEKVGPLEALPWLLEPLKAQRSQLQVLSGLTHDKARANGDGGGDHARAAATFLTGVQPLKTNGAVRLGISADQIAAQQIGGATRFRSLQLGCDRGSTVGQCDSGYACAYSGHISWQGPTTPAGKEFDPRKIFDRLFRGGMSREQHAASLERAVRRRSVLDFVREDAKRLERTLGQEDRARIDEYQSGLRELERRVELAVPQRVDEVADSERPSYGRLDLGLHFQLLADLLVLAFRSDSTRVATLMFGNEGSNRSYNNLGIREGHHSLSHHRTDPGKMQAIRDINRYHMELFAHLVRGLSEVREGDQSLLDSVMLVFGSGLADGDRHSHHDLPVLLVGGGCGTLQPGRHTRYPAETPMTNLHLALLARLGIQQDALGDSTGVLEGI